jgi:adenylate cyclase
MLLSSWISKPLKEIVSGVTRIGRGHFQLQMDDSRRDEFGEINRAVNTMSQSLLERDALQGALSRYVSQGAVKDLIKEGEFPTFRGQRKKMTLLLCEIGNLESLSDILSPALLVNMLNTFFDSSVGVIFQHNGTIDRLPGDGFTAVFGALGNEDVQEKLAVTAALELIATTEELNKQWNLSGNEAFQVQVGVHTGDAIFGNIGSDHRVEFTVVGKSMKIASALGQLNSAFKTKALVSEATYDAVSEDFSFVEIGDFNPSPGEERIRLFTLKDLLPPEAAAVC